MGVCGPVWTQILGIILGGLGDCVTAFVCVSWGLAALAPRFGPPAQYLKFFPYKCRKAFYRMQIRQPAPKICLLCRRASGSGFSRLMVELRSARTERSRRMVQLLHNIERRPFPPEHANRSTFIHHLDQPGKKSLMLTPKRSKSALWAPGGRLVGFSRNWPHSISR